MFILYALFFAIIVTCILLLSRRLVWSYIKKDKLDTAEKLYGFNKGVHKVVSQGTRIIKNESIRSLARPGTNIPFQFLNIIFWVGIDSIAEQYDHSKVIHKELRKEVADLLQFIRLKKNETKHQVVIDFLCDLEKDILEKSQNIEEIQDIREIFETLKFILDTGNDAQKVSELSDEDIADTEPEKQRNYYEIFGISRDASADEIKKAYRTLAQKHHPDKNPGDITGEMFKLINTIYQVLKDPKKRQEYDRSL